MKKIYSKWWFWGTFLFAILFIAFIIKSHLKFNDVSSGDLLNFYGSILSFAGTIILGAVASHQSWKANRLSERLLKIEEERYLPIVDIQEVMELPKHLEKDVYNNSMQVSLNDSEFFFTENNELAFSVSPIFVFKLKNICSNHIISVNVISIEQNTKFNNEKVLSSIIFSFGFNGGVRVLSNDESQFFMISGIQHRFPEKLTYDEAESQGYTGNRTELIIQFELANIKGQKFNEIIKFSFFSSLVDEKKLHYPSIMEKEIISITPVE